MASTLYVGTDISEKMNRTRFYDERGTQLGVRVESINDLPGAQDLAREALSRAARMGAKEILWGLEATNLFCWHLASFLTTHPELLAHGLRCYTFNPRVSSQELLEGYLTPDEIVGAPIEELAGVLKEHSRGRIVEPEEVAEVVKQAARRSYRLSASMVEPVNLILSSSLLTIRTLSTQLKPLDKAIAAQLAATPPQTLSSVPGLGPVFTAGIVAEIGDVNRFEREESLAKFAGLTWRRHQSGEFEGEDRPLSRTGNAYLRYYLVEAANSVRHSCPEFGFYYRKKFGEATRHKHRRALVLTARKLVRLIHSMLRSGRIYQPAGTRRATSS